MGGERKSIHPWGNFDSELFWLLLLKFNSMPVGGAALSSLSICFCVAVDSTVNNSLPVFLGCASGCPNDFTGPLLAAFPPLLEVMKSPITNSPARSHRLLFLCLHPPPLKLQVIISFFLSPLLFPFLSPLVFLLFSPCFVFVSGVISHSRRVPSCLPHRRVLFCSGVRRCISSLYITPLTGSLFMSAFSVWLAKNTIQQTNDRSCCSWKTKKWKKKNTKFLSYV